jgi:predicted metal-dependent enzyme (double-stranded beta helix superfamily)
MFDADRFVEDCRGALAEGPKAVREVVARAVAEPGRVTIALGEPHRAGVTTLHRSADLTVLNLVWGPRMTIQPHNHRIWAVIGIYGGREDNIFWRRCPDQANRVEAAGAKTIGAREVVPLGKDIIHSVTNPLPRLTAAIHVYGGDFFAPGRSEWDPENLVEQPYDAARAMQLFEDSNKFLKQI